VNIVVYEEHPRAFQYQKSSLYFEGISVSGELLAFQGHFGDWKAVSTSKIIWCLENT
jgi:hypothetical protein